MANHSLQENTTLSLEWLSPSECLAWVTVFGIEAVAIVALNAFAITICLKERSLRKRSMCLVINLAVGDMFVGAYSVIIEYLFLGNDCSLWTINFLNRPSVFKLVIVAFFRLFPLASITNLAAISLERMHATFRPFKHRLIKKKIFGAAVAAVWITAVLSSVSIVSRNFVVSTLEFNRGFYISYLSLFLFCLLIIIVSYASIARKIVCGNQPQHHMHGATRRERKLTKTMFIATVASLSLTLPYIIFLFLGYVSKPFNFHRIPIRKLLLLYYSFSFLFYANSLVNPILYTFGIPEFKNALFSVLRCRYRSESAQVLPLDEM